MERAVAGPAGRLICRGLPEATPGFPPTFVDLAGCGGFAFSDTGLVRGCCRWRTGVPHKEEARGNALTFAAKAAFNSLELAL